MLRTLRFAAKLNFNIDEAILDIFTPESQHFAFFAPWAHLNAWEGMRQPWYAGEAMKDAALNIHDDMAKLVNLSSEEAVTLYRLLYKLLEVADNVE